MAKPLDSRTQAARQPDYRRLYKQINGLGNRLEDTITHFHKVINELSNRASTLEKKQGVASRAHNDS
jgi:hypothetical protein